MRDLGIDFDLVLKTDLANIVAKSAAGAPLSAREYKMIEAEKDKAKKTDPVVQPPKESSCELPKVNSRTGFLHQYKHYAEIYGAGARTVQRWVDRGRETGDPCPLDDPSSLRLWWTRNQKNKVPDKLLSAAVKAVREAASHPSAPVVTHAAAVQVQETTPEKAAWEFRKVGEDEVGLEAMLRRVRDMEVQVYSQMEAAMKEGNEAKATMALNMWKSLTTQSRQVEKEARAESEAKGLLIPRLYAEQKIAEFHIPIQNGVRRLYRDMCEIMGTAIDSDSEQKWNATCDKVFKRFQEVVFTS